jgi:hypothetical protein
LAYLNLSLWRFFDDFSCQATSAMLFIKGNLSDTFPMILVGNLPPQETNVLRGLWVLVALFIPFPSWNGLL